MRTVYKFPLPAFAGPPVVEMPQGARILHVGQQGGQLCLWAEVETSRPFEARVFYVVGTGWEMPREAGEYLGTVQMPSGLVWHIYAPQEATNGN